MKIATLAFPFFDDSPLYRYVNAVIMVKYYYLLKHFDFVLIGLTLFSIFCGFTGLGFIQFTIIVLYGFGLYMCW